MCLLVSVICEFLFMSKYTCVLIHYSFHSLYIVCFSLVWEDKRLFHISQSYTCFCDTTAVAQIGTSNMWLVLQQMHLKHTKLNSFWTIILKNVFNIQVLIKHCWRVCFSLDCDRLLLSPGTSLSAN